MMRRERGLVIGAGCVDAAPAICDARPDRDDQGDDDGQPPLEAAWRTDAEAGAHEEPEIESADGDEQPFQDVRVTAQMRPTQPTGFIEVGIRSLEILTAS